MQLVVNEVRPEQFANFLPFVSAVRENQWPIKGLWLKLHVIVGKSVLCIWGPFCLDLELGLVRNLVYCRCFCLMDESKAHRGDRLGHRENM